MKRTITIDLTEDKPIEFLDAEVPQKKPRTLASFWRAPPAFNYHIWNLQACLQNGETPVQQIEASILPFAPGTFGWHPCLRRDPRYSSPKTNNLVYDLVFYTYLECCALGKQPTWQEFDPNCPNAIPKGLSLPLVLYLISEEMLALFLTNYSIFKPCPPYPRNTPAFLMVCTPHQYFWTRYAYNNNVESPYKITK